MSEVWAADDIELGRRVALKLLARDADPARFEREAQAVAALGHPNICRLYDYGEADGRPFMVLEYLGGGTLEDRLVPGEPYPREETERVARELAAGLAHAHAHGLIHRDLKPANVLFDDEGVAKIADFGIARLVGSGTLTETGTLLGTAAYISPEQAQGLPATAASDVYSFGVILYRMLAGRLPFESESPIELARMHIQERPFPLADARPTAPPALVALAEASLAKDPEGRPPDGEALARALSSGEQPTTLSDAPARAASSAACRAAAVRSRSGGRRHRLPGQRLQRFNAGTVLHNKQDDGVRHDNRRAEHHGAHRAYQHRSLHQEDDDSTDDSDAATDAATDASTVDSASSAHDLADNRHHSGHDDATADSASASVISIVIPLHNEERSIALLYDELQAALEPLGQDWEAVFVDDGSVDGSFAALTRLHDANENVRVVRLRRNFGKAAALAAGFGQARGEIVVTIDADLQDDPAEIPRLLVKLDEGFDLVSGWKTRRRDPLRRRVLSRIFNWVTGRMSGLRLHDMNCGLKAYRSEVVRGMPLYGELHRFIPVLAHYRGFRIAELPVNHRPRAHGRSRYGLERYLRGFLDLLTVSFMGRYRHRPLHLFGGLGLLLGALGIAVLAYLTVVKIGGHAIGQRPLLTLGVLLVVVGMQFFSLGLISEMITSHHEERAQERDRAELLVDEILS